MANIIKAPFLLVAGLLAIVFAIAYYLSAVGLAVAWVFDDHYLDWLKGINIDILGC